MDSCRKTYDRFYHDFSRGGVSDTQFYAPKDVYQKEALKDQKSEQNEGVSSCMKELMEVKLKESQQTQKASKRKFYGPKKEEDPHVQRKKLEVFMKDNSDQIFAF